jgi:hypothetical protein
MTHASRPAALFVLFASLFAAGCGGKPTGDLSGKVTYKSKPVVVGTVTVYDAEKKVYQGGIDQGVYTVKNVPEGAVQIIVMSPNPGGDQTTAEDPRRPKRDARPGEEKAAPVAGWMALPKKYEDAGTSPFKTTVKAGPNPFDLELKD